MRIAVVGLGARVQTIVANLTQAEPGTEVVAVFDPDKSEEQIRSAHGAANAQKIERLSDITALDEIDLFMIGSPTHVHLEQLKALSDTKVPVFCEKPAVLTRDESFDLARLVADGAFRGGLAFGFVLRFTGLFRFLLDCCRAQRVLNLEANEYLHPEHGSYISRNWRRRRALGGPYLLDKACHDFDVHARLFGCRPARIASFATQLSFGPRGAFKDQETTDRYHLLDGGWGMAESSFGADNELTDCQVIISEYENGGLATFNTTMHSSLQQRRIFLSGTQTTLEADFHRNRALARPAYSDAVIEEMTFEGNFLDHYGGDPKIAHALAEFATSGQFDVTPKEAIEAGLMALAYDEAAQSRAVVDLTPLWAELDTIL